MAFQRSGGVYIKRVIGLPEEDIKIIGGQVYIDERPLIEDYTQGISGVEEHEWFNGSDEYFCWVITGMIATIAEHSDQCRLT